MHRPLRIFHLIKSLGRGGAEVLLSEGLRHADRERFTYGYGYFLPGKDAVAPELEQQGAEVVCFEAQTRGGLLLASWKVARFIRRWDADLVHCHLPLAGVAGRLAGWWAGVPVVYTEHNEWEYYHPLTQWAGRATWPLQRQVVAVSSGVAESVRRNTGGKVPVQTVRNGVDVAAFIPDEESARAVRRRWEIAPEAPIIGTVAVFRGQKQLHHWLQVARRIHEERPVTRFLVVGHGPLYDDLNAYRRALDLEDVVHFAGFQTDVKPFLSAMDCYMMTSIIEGLPIAMLEAMSMQLPVLTTAVGGIPEVVQEGVSGRLIPLRVDERDTARFMQRTESHFDETVSDTEAFVAAALPLIDHPEQRLRMGRAARATIETRFSMQRMTRELEALYQNVLTR